MKRVFLLFLSFMVLTNINVSAQVFTNELQNLNDNLVPTNWVLNETNPNSYLSGGKLYAYITDASGNLERVGTMPANIESVVYEWDGNIEDVYWAITNSIVIKFLADNYFSLSHGSSQYHYSGDYSWVRIYYNDGVSSTQLFESFPPREVAGFHYIVTLTNTQLQYTAKRLSDNSTYFDVAVDITDKNINIQNIVNLKYNVSTTTEHDAWIDNLQMTLNEVTPVELTNFTASTINNSVILNWQTATEVNNYGFSVERKTTTDWEKIAFVEGHGNSNSPKEYSFVDTDKLSGTVKYRLKQIDIDGAFEYSDVVEVEINFAKEFRLSQNYPNPFNPTTMVSYTLPTDSKVKIEVTNMLGQSVGVLVNDNKSAGYYEITWNAENLPSGIYFINITANGVNSTESFTQVKKALLLK